MSLILAIETSCDETAVALVRDGHMVLANLISSQIALHAQYGGVVPEIASRCHLQALQPMIQEAMEAMEAAHITPQDIDAIAVTYGPGLVGALLVGVSAAKALAFAWGKPLVAVHHIEGHISANFLTHSDLRPPCLCLVVSGGHSHIVQVTDYGRFKVLGQTQDDAAGEALDKVARALGLGYPGGPAIDKLAKTGNLLAVKLPSVALPPYNFSFSGIKTAVVNLLHKAEQKGEAVNVADYAASFQHAVVEGLVGQAIAAAKDTGSKTLLLAGGVAANSLLRERLAQAAQEKGIVMYMPPLEYCTDNAAMVGCAAHFRFVRGEQADMRLNAVPALALDAI